MLKKISLDNRGLTLLELIIVLALISLILAGAFSIFIFGNNTFFGGTRQRDLQADVRMTLETLTHDVRYATKLEVLSGGGIDVGTLLTPDGSGIFSAVDPYQTYIFYNPTSESVIRLQRESLTQVNMKTDAAIPLVFNLAGSPTTTLTYQVNGVNDVGSKEFNVDSTVLMLNIIDESGNSRATGVSNGVAIRYMTPEDNIAEMQYPETQLVGTNTNLTLEITFNKQVQFSDEYDVTPGSKKDPLLKEYVDISPIGLPTSEILVEFDNDTGKPTSFVDGDTIDLYLAYGSTGEYAAVYTLVYMGGSLKKWVIE